MKKLVQLRERIEIKILALSEKWSSSGRLDLTERAMFWLVRYSQFGWGTPFNYNNEKKLLEMANSTWYMTCYKATVLFAWCVTACRVGNILYDMNRDDSYIRGRIGPFRIMSGGIASMTNIFKLSIILNADQLIETWNLILNFIPNFRDAPEVRQSTRKFDFICCALIIVLMGLMTVIEWVYLGMYIYQCEYNVLAGFLPICYNGKHGSYGMIVFYGCLAYFDIHHDLLAMGMIASCILVAVYACKHAMDDMERVASVEGKRWNQTEAHEWNTNYRTLQILHALHHSSFGHIVIPSFFLLVLLLLVMANYLIIVPGTDPIIRGTSIMVNECFVIFIIFVIRYATAFPDGSENLLRLRLIGTSGQEKKYLVRFVKSCQQFRVWVGHFFSLKREVIPELLSIVIETTIDVLLA